MRCVAIGVVSIGEAGVLGAEEENLNHDEARGCERYLLLKASSVTVGFFSQIKKSFSFNR